MQVSRFVALFVPVLVSACSADPERAGVKPVGDGHVWSDSVGADSQGSPADVVSGKDTGRLSDHGVKPDSVSVDVPVAKDSSQPDVHAKACYSDMDCVYEKEPKDVCTDDGQYHKYWNECQNGFCGFGYKSWDCGTFECSVQNGCLFDCYQDSDCTVGEFCDQTSHTCETIPACSSNADCVQPSPAVGCNSLEKVLFSAVCVAGVCEQQQQVLELCTLGCVDAQCVEPECTVDADCGTAVTTYSCSGNSSVAATEQCFVGTCGTVTVNIVCDNGCDAATGKCIQLTPECLNDLGCTGGTTYSCAGTNSIPSKELCVSGTCTFVNQTGTSCPNGCDSVTGTCKAAPPQCVADTDCGSSGGVLQSGCTTDNKEEVGKIGCVSGSCKYVTVSLTPCPNGCDIPTGKCVGAPVECSTNGDCNSKFDGTGCAGGYYVTYTTICSSNVCVQTEQNSEWCTNGCTASGCAGTATVSCATELNPGILFRGYSSTTVYYCGSDGKKYMFPDAQTFVSWYPSGTSVMQVADALVDQFVTGGNVKIRPGTWLVKITTNPKTYAVEPCGKLRKLPDEATASALYGSNWNTSLVKDVQDVIWGDYWDSAQSLSTSAYPAGTVVLANGQYYYVQPDGTWSLLTADGYLQNNFQNKFVRTKPATMTFTEGISITGLDPLIFDPAQLSCP